MTCVSRVWRGDLQKAGLCHPFEGIRNHMQNGQLIVVLLLTRKVSIQGMIRACTHAE